MERPVVIYDRECALCRRAVRALPRDEFDLLPYQSPDRAALFPGLTDGQCEQAMQLATRDGRMLSGVDALPLILAATPRWRWLAPLVRLRAVRWLLRPAYRFVASHRR